jgi:hypothetical protein
MTGSAAAVVVVGRPATFASGPVGRLAATTEDDEEKTILLMILKVQSFKIMTHVTHTSNLVLK